MIVTISSHGRSKKDCDAVVAHLLKTDENDFIKIAEIGHSSATSLEDVVQEMQLQRDSSAALVSLHHLTINPSANCTDDRLVAAAHAMRIELDPDDQRPYVIVIHGKKREGVVGSETHAHVLLGHVFCGVPLKDRLSKRRTEMVARVCEYNFGEHCTLGPGHRYSIKRLRSEAPKVAQWLIDAHGENPEKPRSAMSANTRQRAKRAGVSLPKAKASVVAAWQLAQEPSAFRAALRADGLEIIAGKKANVLLVVDAEGNLIGSLDRLLRKKRHEVLHLLETDNGISETEIEHSERASDDRARPATLQPGPGDQRKADNAVAAADAAGNSRVVRGGGPDRANSSISGVLGAAGRATDRVTPDDRRKARRTTKFARYRALNQLRSLGRRMAKSEGLAHYCWSPDDYIWNGAVSIWGVPIEPPRRFQP
jgi:hypothetical protein